MWRLESENYRDKLKGHSDSVICIAFSPNAKYLASGGDDKTVKLWDSDQRKELITLRGHSDSVLSIAFSADGVYLASGSADKTIKLWSLRS
jgi:WD40 repeat protein